MMFLTLVALVVIATYPFKVIEIKAEFKVLTPVVKQGELLEYQVNAEKFMPITGTKKCSFEDGIVFFLPTVESKLDVGVHNETVGVPIPETLPLGSYKYHCKVDYQITPFRTVNAEFYTETFEVTK